MLKSNAQYYWYLLGTSTFLLVFVSLQFFVPISISAVDTSSQSIELPNENSDPTMSRAAKFIGKKVPEAVTHHNQLRDTFVKSLKQGDLMYFNQWATGIINPLFVAAWEEEWRDYPESHPAFALYIRDEIKTSKELRKILDPNLDDEALFRNYLKLNEKYAEENLQKQAELEEKIGGIPEDLKVAIRNPDSYSFVSMIYYHYDNVQSLRQLRKQRQKQQDAEIARRKAIIPVSRDSREYQKAFQEYKDVVAEQEQILKDAAKNDPTWNYSRDLILNGKVGESGFPGKQIDEFAASIKEEQRKDFRNWVQGVTSKIGATTLKNEWDTKPESHPAINLNVAMLLSRMNKLPQETSKPTLESFKRYLNDDGEILNQLIESVQELNGISASRLKEIETELSIPSTLKNAIERNSADSTLFTIYDTYMRACVPNEFSDAEKRVKECVHRLNNLRPEWAIEEKIEFPDKFSWKMHQLGLDVEKPYWTWQRILLMSLLFLFILWGVKMKIKKWFEKKGDK
jgi:5'-deoxynucleotidase YfbR-like HD superfamily hydrolase